MSPKRHRISQPQDELIDEHLFVEALALCALEMPYSDPQPSNIEKALLNSLGLLPARKNERVQWPEKHQKESRRLEDPDGFWGRQ